MRSFLSPAMQFLLEDSSSSDDSDFDEVDYDDIEDYILILAMKELEDRQNTRTRRGSKVGRLCIPRKRALGHSMLMKDHFTEASKTSKKTGSENDKKTPNMPPGGPRPTKRVKASAATEQPTRVSTRPATKELTLAPVHEIRTEEQLDAIAVNEDQLASAQPGEDRRHHVSPTLTVEDRSNGRDNFCSPSHTRNLSDHAFDGVGHTNEHTQLRDEDIPPIGQRGKRPQTRGILLDSMNKTMGRRLSINVALGNKRPEKSVQAAKLASEGSITIRQRVPVLSREKNKDQETSAIDLSKECHNSKKRSFGEPVQQAGKEAVMEECVEDGQTPRSNTKV